MFRKITASLLTVAVLVMPATSQAATVNTSAVFNSLTTQEKIAYLYGMIAQLQLLIEWQLENEGSSSSGRSRIAIETRPATNIKDDEATLRLQLDLNGEDEARVWFEYGEDTDLDDDTAKRRVTDSRGDDQSISITIDDLDEDERYYFRAVVEDEDGDRRYGSIRNFRTDDDGGSSSAGDFELDVSDTLIDEGDEVDVDWQIPDDETGSQNWIGLYEVGDDNRNYVTWVYIDNDDSGTESFEIDDEGEYEFRLFLDNSYDDEVTSDRVEVR